MLTLAFPTFALKNVDYFYKFNDLFTFYLKEMLNILKELLKNT